jgi:hypothetical protein
MKQTVAKELQSQKYTTYYEPLDSPYRNLWWDCFRPDVLATRYCKGNLQVVLVECETKPNRKRVLRKTVMIKRNLSLQKRLYENALILPLLVIPPFNLVKVICSAVRRFWEIWIVNQLGEIRHKISRNNFSKKNVPYL